MNGGHPFRKAFVLYQPRDLVTTGTFRRRPLDEASKHFGWFAHFAALDNPTSSERTRTLLGRNPKEPGLISDLEHGRYF